MYRTLSDKDKRKYLKLIAQRDGGYLCLYCKKKLTPRTLNYEHLNGSWKDNRLDNFAFSCQSCNIKKANEDRRIQKLADWKLEDNEKKLFVGEKFPEIWGKEDENEKPSSEIEINEKSWNITEEFIRNELGKKVSISYKQTLDSCIFLCKKKTGHGSYNTIKRHIDALSSPLGPFSIDIDDKNKKIIVKRFSN